MPPWLGRGGGSTVPLGLGVPGSTGDEAGTVMPLPGHPTVGAAGKTGAPPGGGNGTGVPVGGGETIGLCGPLDVPGPAGCGERCGAPKALGGGGGGGIKGICVLR